jgi:hypothetical protein
LGAIDTTYVTDAVEFLYGRPIRVEAEVASAVDVRPLDVTKVFAVAGLAQFGHTATFTSVEVMDANGNWTTDFTLATGAVGLYRFQTAASSTVAEPSSIASLLTGLVSLTGAGLWRRRRRTK